MPRDNIYAHFKSIVPIVDVVDLLAQINETGFTEVEGNSRDYQIQPRYERQFAVQLASLARLFGPTVVRTAAVSVGDPYLREGTDLTAVFQVVNRTLFYLGHDTYIQFSRREFGPDLRQDRETYQNVVIESFVTPRREISLYRAAFGDFIALANSLVGMKRVIDTYKGLVPSVADAPDFRYYRSVYPVRNVAEDGFVFLSTAFQRRILGPELFLKRRRRPGGVHQPVHDLERRPVRGLGDRRAAARPRDLVGAIRAATGGDRFPRWLSPLGRKATAGGFRRVQHVQLRHAND